MAVKTVLFQDHARRGPLLGGGGGGGGNAQVCATRSAGQPHPPLCPPSQGGVPPLANTSVRASPSPSRLFTRARLRHGVPSPAPARVPRQLCAHTCSSGSQASSTPLYRRSQNAGGAAPEASEDGSASASHHPRDRERNGGGGGGEPEATVSPHQRAIMEAAVCASVVHRNVVATYHYDVTPVRGAWLAAGRAIAARGGGGARAWLAEGATRGKRSSAVLVP